MIINNRYVAALAIVAMTVNNGCTDLMRLFVWKL